MNRFRKWIIWLAAVSWALCGPVSASERRPLDGVVAIVNDDVILASELGEEVAARLYQLGPRAAAARDLKEFAAEVLKAMIDTRLLIQEADARNIVVSNEEVKVFAEEEVARIRAAFPSEEDYAAALASYGLTEKTYLAQLRKSIRDQIKVNRLNEELFGTKISLPEDEIKAYYQSHREEFGEPATVTLREITVAKKPSPASLAATRAKLEEVRRAVGAGGDFASHASKLAAAEKGEFNKSFVFKSGETLPALEAAVASLVPGEVSPVVAAGDSYWLLRLVAVSGGRYEVQYLRLPIRVSEVDVSQARGRAEAAVAALAAGEDFAAVAKRFSDDAETASGGGLVGGMDVGELEREMPEVARAIANLGPGETTPIIEQPDSFLIVKVESRSEARDVSYEEARETVKRVLRAQKIAAAQQKYLLELKEKSYIKIYE